MSDDNKGISGERIVVGEERSTTSGRAGGAHYRLKVRKELSCNSAELPTSDTKKVI